MVLGAPEKEAGLLYGKYSSGEGAQNEPYGPQLKDGTPFYYLFLSDPEAISLKPQEAQSAKERAAEFVSKYPDTTEQCKALSVKDAKKLISQQELN